MSFIFDLDHPPLSCSTQRHFISPAVISMSRDVFFRVYVLHDMKNKPVLLRIRQMLLDY